MARSNYNEVVIDNEGNALENIQVTVIDTETDDEALIFSGMTGGSTQANPFITGGNGVIDFKAAPGSYRLDLHDTELPARVSDRSLYWQSVPGADQGIPTEKVDLTGVTGDISIDEDGVSSIGAGKVGSGTLDLTSVYLKTLDDDYFPTSAVYENVIVQPTPNAGTYFYIATINLSGAQTTGASGINANTKCTARLKVGGAFLNEGGSLTNPGDANKVGVLTIIGECSPNGSQDVTLQVRYGIGADYFAGTTRLLLFKYIQ